MKILQVCPLWYPITPDSPGGIETFLARLFDKFHGSGCDLTVLASGGSKTSGTLVPVIDAGLAAEMAAGRIGEQVYYEQHQVLWTIAHGAEFDVIHSHIGPGGFVLSEVPAIGDRVVHTQHTPIYSDFIWFTQVHPDIRLTTVSEFQSRQLPHVLRCEAIHNGIDVSSFTFSHAPGDELLFIGRMEHMKGPDAAIHVAHSLGRPLILAGPIIDGKYFEEQIKPYLGDDIRYVGVVDHRQKNELFGRSACAVLPFRGAESFGLVTLEAMACGTPVVALPNGALPEIVEPGLTGYLAAQEAELPALTEAALRLARAPIRARVAERFDVAVVAAKYRDLYERMARTRVRQSANV